MGIKHAGDFELVTMEISAKNSVVDVRHLLVELNIFQDLFADGITANVVLADSRNLPLHIPLIGDEILSIIFNTPTDLDKMSDVAFHLPIISLSKREQIKEKQQLLVLNCVSEPMLESAKTTISKSYKGKLHSEIVKDIFDTHINQFDLVVDIEPSKYTENLVIPNCKPFEAIRFITERAISSKGTADFLFYEGRDNYHFKSINTMLQQEPVMTLSTNPAGLGDTFNILKIMDYYHNVNYNMKTNVQRGMLGSTILSWDPDNKELVKKEFSYIKSFDKQSHLGKQKLVYDDTELSSPLNRLFFESITTDTRSDEWRAQRQSALQVINNNRVVVTLPGNTSLDIGLITNFNIPSMEEQDTSILQQNDTLLSGKWLITSIRHKVEPTAHTMVLDLAKESFDDKL